MEEILDIYKRPYNVGKPVVCMDESSKQLIKEVNGSIPMQPILVEEVPQISPERIESLSSGSEAIAVNDKTQLLVKRGQVEKYDTEYERNGTANIFMAFEPLQGLRFTDVTDQRKKTDWAEFIKELVDMHYPDAETIILVLDNLNTHNKSSLYEKFEPTEAKRIADKLEIHYTPKHGSWLNMAEIELSHLSRQCLDTRISEKSNLAAEVNAWTAQRNNKKVVAKWQFTTEDARIKLRRLYPST